MIKGSENKKILVTGGAGYIGSHMLRVLLETGHDPVVFDNLSTGHRDFIPQGVPFVKGDLKKITDIQKVFKKYDIGAVIHFAASIVVPESVDNPLKYYENNVGNMINLLKVMEENNVQDIVFSSSACVYGDPLRTPILETEPLKIANPYGATKVMGEMLLEGLAQAKKIRFIAFRYFNVAGVHPSCEIGIKMDKPTHLIPNVMMAALGKIKKLKIFGTDYPTKDGTCVRDYIHVLDLCEAHALALKALAAGKVKNEVINLGNAKGFSVKEIVQMTEQVLNCKVPVSYTKRRKGDSAKVVASYAKAKRLLGWKPTRTLKDIISSAWAWEKKIS